MPVETCLVCGSSAHHALFTVDAWPIRRCDACRFVFIGMLPDWSSKTEINERRYEHSQGLASRARARMQLRDDVECLDQIERFSHGGTLLDVGCATGNLLALARDRGWSVKGIELDRGLASEAASRIGVSNVSSGTLAEAPFQPQSFDVVVMRSVLEHLPDPARELDRVRTLLKPNGSLFLLVPNVESLESRVYRSRWFALTPGDHLWFFSPSTLESFLRKNGYAAEWLTTSESFRDMFVGFSFAAWFAVRSMIRRNATSSPAPAAPVEHSTGFFGRHFSRSMIATVEHLMEWARWVSLPVFSLYAGILSRRGLGASIRGMFVPVGPEQ